MTGGVVGGAVTSSSPLVIVFSLFSLIVVIPGTRKIKFEEKIKEKEKK